MVNWLPEKEVEGNKRWPNNPEQSRKFTEAAQGMGLDDKDVAAAFERLVRVIVTKKKSSVGAPRAMAEMKRGPLRLSDGRHGMLPQATLHGRRDL